MAVVDNFDSYSIGALNGQGGWSGSNNFLVQIAVYQSSPNAVSCIGNADDSIAKSMTLAGTGVQTVYCRFAGQVDELLRFFLRESGNSIILVSYLSGHLKYFNGASYIDLGAVSLNTWIKLDIQWDIAQQKARYRLDNGSWTSYDTLYTNMSSGINELFIKHAITATAAYFDSFADGAAAAPVYANALLDLI